jgi:hypothetical protein
MVITMPNEDEICPNCKDKGFTKQTITTSDGRSDEMTITCYCRAGKPRSFPKDSAVIAILKEGKDYFTHQWVEDKDFPEEAKCHKCSEWTGEINRESACIYETAEVLDWFESKLKELGA